MMKRLRPWQIEDTQTMLSWMDGETTFYRWSRGKLGSYPICAETLTAWLHQQKAVDAFPMVMEDEGEAVGFVLISCPELLLPKDWRLGFVLLNPKRRGRGEGEKLIRLALRTAFDTLEAQSVRIGAYDNNLPAKRCYEKVGFSQTDEMGIPSTIDGETWIWHEMQMSRCMWTTKKEASDLL